MGLPPVKELDMKNALTAVALAAALVTTAGCARNRAEKGDTRYVARDVETLYNLAKERMDRGAYRQSAVLFDEVERQHPYSVWARRAILMSAFSYYAAGQYAEAVQAGQRFLALHPGNRDAPYAYYVIAVSHYEQITDVSRDQQTSQRALDSLNELVRRYPESNYAADARLKIDLVNDHLAGKEMEVGRFYARNRQWIAAADRFRRVVDRYQTTSHTPEALQRLTEAYLALGIPEEAKKATAVLGANYPGSVWYQRAYDLVREHGAA
jgi:outer membrane protein assembly factor BamD